jgi:hypothetical protein
MNENNPNQRKMRQKYRPFWLKTDKLCLQHHNRNRFDKVYQNGYHFKKSGNASNEARH